MSSSVASSSFSSVEDDSSPEHALRMSVETIKIFARIRPVKRISENYTLVRDPSGTGPHGLDHSVEFYLPHSARAGYVNHSRERFEFRFNHIFDTDAMQDEVFDMVARPSIRSVLEGFNSTIFAYGQTGSGKTYTMTGGTKDYNDRGIIPRTLSMLFSELRQRANYQFSVHISYLEIYNERGYDLLADVDAGDMEDLPRVKPREDADGNLHLVNLGTHLVNTEEDALNLLFLGDLNRAISETPMNEASSRSHCIFTIHIEARAEASAVVRRTKLHLVDLAGSERVYKSGVEGSTLTEAKYINLAFHYLEQVIISLSERKSHVPYRNSFMTSVLRDSLGGNCKTSMVATLNPSMEHFAESISTCRFAQRVANIRQTAIVNEELDPQIVIRRLRREIADLKEELSFYKGGQVEVLPLTESELRRCRELVESFIHDKQGEVVLPLNNPEKIRAFFDILREFASLQISGGPSKQGNTSLSHLSPPSVSEVQNEDQKSENSTLARISRPRGASSDLKEGDPVLQNQVDGLLMQIQERDYEINMLLSFLKKNQRGKMVSSSTQTSGQSSAPSSPSFFNSATRSSSSALSSGFSSLESEVNREEFRPPSVQLPSRSRPISIQDSSPSTLSGARRSNQIDPQSAEVLADRNKAFEMFRKSYRKNEVIEEQKASLKSRFEEARSLSDTVNSAKTDIDKLKSHIERLRAEKALRGDLLRDGNLVDMNDPEEREVLELLSTAKNRYKESYQKLRSIKQEISNIQTLMESSRNQLQNDFKKWYRFVLEQRASSSEDGLDVSHSSVLQSPSAFSHSSAQISHAVDSHRPSEIRRNPRSAWSDSDSSFASSTLEYTSGNSVNIRKSGGDMRTGIEEVDSDVEQFYSTLRNMKGSRRMQD